MIHLTTTAIVLLAVTGFVLVLVVGALVTGTAFSLGGHGSNMRLVRMAEEPTMYWGTVLIQAGFLGFMIWMDITRVLPGIR